MSNQDWFRNSSWTPEIREKFFARLKRSRTDYNKSQYIRIQAYALQHEASPPLYEAALDLLDDLIEKYPHPSQLASAYMQKAQCLERLGKISDATEAFLLSLAAENIKSGVKTTAPLEFAMFVIRHNLREQYDNVASLLLQDGVKRLTMFPVGQYQACATLAIIASESGHKIEARELARKALDASRIRDNGLTHHPNIGLVDNPDSHLQRKLEEIIGG